jgi:hypothetical protein
MTAPVLKSHASPQKFASFCRRSRTSGVAVGPKVAILNTATIKPLPLGEEGLICISGEPCFCGYGTIANDPSETI